MLCNRDIRIKRDAEDENEEDGEERGLEKKRIDQLGGREDESLRATSSYNRQSQGLAG